MSLPGRVPSQNTNNSGNMQAYGPGGSGTNMQHGTVNGQEQQQMLLTDFFQPHRYAPMAPAHAQMRGHVGIAGGQVQVQPVAAAPYFGGNGMGMMMPASLSPMSQYSNQAASPQSVGGGGKQGDETAEVGGSWTA